MWASVAVAVASHASANRVKSLEELRLEEELHLRVHNTAVKELWDRYTVLNTLQDPYCNVVLDQYNMILALSRE